MNKSKDTQKGFALLLSMIISGVVLSVGMSMLSVTIKQLDLGTTTQGSEVAFQAAAAGMDCLRYLRNEQADKFTDNAQFVTIECFGGKGTMADSWGGNNARNQFDKSFDWTVDGVSACITLETYILNAVVSAESWPTVSRGTLECGKGNICTFAYVQANNTSCATVLGNSNVVVRELTAEF